MAFGEIFLAGQRGWSRAGNIAPSFPLRQPITEQDFVHLAAHVFPLASTFYQMYEVLLQVRTCSV